MAKVLLIEYVNSRVHGKERPPGDALKLFFDFGLFRIEFFFLTQAIAPIHREWEKRRVIVTTVAAGCCHGKNFYFPRGQQLATQTYKSLSTDQNSLRS